MPASIGRRRQEAIEKANALLAQSGPAEPPVDVEELARRQGVEVRYEDLEDQTSGVLVRKNGDAVIGVNRNHHRNRRRFTVAHELGHWALHSEESGYFVDDFTVHYRGDGSTRGYDPRESEANAFAASLLMPEDALRNDLAGRRIDASDDDQLSKLADRYEVSLQALTIRLANLNLLAF